MEDRFHDETLIYEEETYAIRGAAFEVYKQMSNGFLEAVYQECLERELATRNIPFVTQAELRLLYKEQSLQQTYKADLVCYGKIIVELKAARAISDEHKAQVLNYLKATGFRLGMILNFGHYPKLEVERIIL